MSIPSLMVIDLGCHGNANLVAVSVSPRQLYSQEIFGGHCEDSNK